jgi:hypothetical protein
MFKKQTSLFLFFLLMTLAGFSNSRLFPGYYIDPKGDSVRCNIEFNDWNLNPKTLKVEVNSKKMEFTPNDIRGFGVDGYDDYVSATVQTHTAAVAGKDVPAQFSDDVVINTYFLKILNRGFFSLYDLVLTDRVYLFFQLKDSALHELVYRMKGTNDSLFVDQQYKNVLLSFFVQEGISDKYFNRVSNTIYSASEIQSLFNILNESHGGYSYHKKAKQEFQIQLYMGGIRNLFPSPINAYYLTKQFNPANSMTGGLSLLYSIPGKFNSFKIGFSAGYNSYNGKLTEHTTNSFYVSAANNGTSTYDDTLTTKNSLVQTNFYLMYMINPLSRVKCYLKAGISLNFSLNTENSVNESYSGFTKIVQNGNPPVQNAIQNSGIIIPLKERYLTPLFGIGVNFDRSTLEFSYCLPADIGSQTKGPEGESGPAFKISSMTLSYSFSVFQTK